MPSRPVPFTPTLDQYHMFLDACLTLAPFKFLRHVVRSMRQTGCKPNNESFRYLIRSRWDAANTEDKVPHVAVFSSIIADMALENLPYDPSIEELLYESYASRKHKAWGQQIRDEYRSRFLDDNALHKQKFTEWNQELSEIAQSKGIQTAVDHFFQSLIPKGCEQQPSVARAILRHSKSYDDVKMVTQKFDLPITVEFLSLLVSNNVRAGNIEHALSLYNNSKSAGVVPNAALVHPLIKALCQAQNPPLDESLDKALAIYDDLLAVADPSPEEKKSYDEHARGPDAAIYHTLLRALASSGNFQKYFPIAKELLDDMDTHKIPTDNSFAASSIIVLFMRRAESLADAMDVYYGLRSSLDERGYAVVLSAFSKLSFGNDLPIPSLTNYFDIVSDMRRAGLEITVEVYTILLNQLASVATQYRSDLPADTMHDLITTTRRVHDFLTLDAAVSPDEQVFNQLMDTYQRLGCFGDAYRVWETMYISGRFNRVSVSIIFDACGYAGALHIAKKVFAQLGRDRFSMDLHNWNTWVECLCRLNRLDDAMRVACLEMGKNENTIAPGVETARILIKFARRDGFEADVQERLKRYLPELWKKLPEDLRQPKN
ncbi:hypothetical protein H0H92_002107 [Tricholoma furcatifolium]|nr:hypothetical protein H0H92_002107 [Tricholoma furcatifolium]